MAKKYSSANKESVSVKQSAEFPSPSLGIYEILITIAFIFLLSLSGSMDNNLEKWTGLLSAIILLIFLLISKRASVLKEYITPLFYSVLAYIVWGGISTFYAASSKFAIFEFSKLLVALSVYIIVLFFTDPNQSGFKRISLILASTGCFFGVISVDAASFGILSNIFRSILGVFTANYNETGFFEQGIRITSIFGNPNTYAGFMALSVILSLYLVSHASGKKDTILATSLLALNSLAYILAFSMGSLFMFIIACLTMIICSEKGHRISLFLLMFETVILTFFCAFLSMLGLGKTGFITVLPILSLLLNAFLLYQIDTRIRPGLSEKMNTNIKLLFRTVLIIIIIIAGYSLAAFTVSSDLPISKNESIMRGLYLSAGEYTIEVDSSKQVLVSIESQNNYDLMRHTSTNLYMGPNDQAISFTVPDNSRIVQVSFFSAADKNSITKAEYTGAENGDIHLNYPLLPKIMANRVQNLFANENVVQRTIFFQDGLELFSKSPLIGRGLGGFENGVYSVQDFFYETKYAHNHYIQVLSDLGIIGFVLFASMLLLSVIAIVKAKINSRSLFAVPILAACSVQIFGQALVDAVWSTGVFLCFSAALLALITIFCSKPLNLKESFNKDRLRIVEKAALMVFTGIFVLLLSGNLYAQAQAKAGVEGFDAIERLIIIDRFEYNDYKLSYIVNAPKIEDENVLAQADIYAKDLSSVESNSLAPYIVAYNFQRYYDYDAFDTAKNGIMNNQSNPYMWVQLFNAMEDYIDPVGPNMNDAADRLTAPELYINGVLDLYDMLVARNESSLDDITLTPSNDAFIGKMLEIRDTHLLSADWVFTAIMTYAFDSTSPVDANQDGLPDNIAIVSGRAEGDSLGAITVSENTIMDLNLYHKLRGKYTFKIETETPQGIKIAYNEQEQSVTYTDDEAYLTIDLADNSDKALSKFTVTYPASAKIDAITFTTKLE